MADDQKDREIDDLLRDGQGQLTSATQLSTPPCHLCGKPQNRWYIDLRYTGVERYVVCIPCANSRRLEGEWENPDVPREAAPDVDPSRFRVVPPADEMPGL